eukprot:jgi/Psemu1/308043/fgenesh1_kg.375_\
MEVEVELKEGLEDRTVTQKFESQAGKKRYPWKLSFALRRRRVFEYVTIVLALVLVLVLVCFVLP